MSHSQLGPSSTKSLPIWVFIQGWWARVVFVTAQHQKQHTMPTTDCLQTRVLFELFVHISVVRSPAVLAQSHTALEAAAPRQLQPDPVDGDTLRAASERGRTQVSRTQLAGCRAWLTSVPTSQQLPALFAPLPLLLPTLCTPWVISTLGCWWWNFMLGWGCPGKVLAGP